MLVSASACELTCFYRVKDTVPAVKKFSGANNCSPLARWTRCLCIQGSVPRGGHAGAAIVPAHNHPSGEAQSSETDIRATRDMIHAGQVMKTEVLDHVIIGNSKHCLLRK